MLSRVGIVLAGGLGTRLALGRPKALALLDGRTLLDRAVATLEGVTDTVLVVAPESLDLGTSRGRRVPDAAGHAGPLAGLVAGLECGTGSACLVLGVDFPCVVAALIATLGDRLDAARGLDAVVMRPGGIEQPLVAAYAPAAAAKLRSALESGVTSLRGGLRLLAVRWVDDAEIATLPGGAESLLNVNTPADLERAQRILAAGVRSVS